MNFEYAAINGFRHGCTHADVSSRCGTPFFHCLCHSEEWKGLQKRYETEAEFALQMRLLSALASVPAYNVALSKIVNYGLPSWQY